MSIKRVHIDVPPVQFTDDISVNAEQGPEFRPPSATRQDESGGPSLIPQLHRIPVFTQNGESGTRRNSPPRVPANMQPTKPPGSRPKARSASQNSGSLLTASKQINLENRILVRLASVMPNERPSTGASTNGGTGNGPAINYRLPESRNNLIKLNHDLDNIVQEIRTWGLTGDKFVMGDIIEAEEIALPMDNMPTESALADAIIADLSQQAGKKVSRIKKSIRAFLQKIKSTHDEEVQRLHGQIHQLSSQLHMLQINQSDITTIPISPSHSVAARSSSNAALENALELDIQSKNGSGKNQTPRTKTSPPKAKPLFSIPDEDPNTNLRVELQDYITERLDIERKVSSFALLISLVYIL
jgi:hypothetical protein